MLMQISLPTGTAAELAVPGDGRPPSHGLVVVPDVGGLRPLFADMAQDVAESQGWAVCVFEPWADGAPGTLAERLEQVGSLSDERMLGDAAAAADACQVEPVGIIGFCMGGMYALKAAGAGRFARSVAFYGMVRIPEQWRGPGQGEPLEALASPSRCPTMAIVGTADIWTPPADVEALENAGVTVIRYEGAEHGFVHAPDRPAHRPKEAADAWARAFAFLDEAETGKGET